MTESDGSKEEEYLFFLESNSKEVENNIKS
jgi:hypothetical protein